MMIPKHLREMKGYQVAADAIQTILRFWQ